MPGLIDGYKGLVYPTVFNIIDNTLNIHLGSTYQIEYAITPESTTNKKIYWSSSDTSIATVDSKGLITTVAAGVCTITGTLDSNHLTDSVSITIYVIHTTGVSLNKNNISLTPSSPTQQLKATLTPSDTDYPGVTWTSSNSNVATVSNTGLVTYIGDGNCTITCTTDDGGYTATCAVACEIPVTGISLNESEISLDAGSTFQLVATISPADATHKTVTWSSSNTSIVTVDSNGLVTGIGEGEAIITATTDDGGYTATCSTSSGYVINANTLSYFPFKNDFIDKKGNRTLTVNDCTISEGSAKINSKTSYMTLSSGVGGSQMTISVWYYYGGNSADGGWNTLFARTGGTYHHFLFPAKTDNGTIGAIGFYNSSKYLSNTILRLNNWYHIVVVKNGTNEKIYINSELAYESNSSFDNNSYPVGTIANYNAGQQQGAQGRMSDLIFESGTWNETKIVKYFDLTKKRYELTINDYDELEYIQSTGTQYIDTLCRLNTTSKVDSFEGYVKATHTGSGNFLGTKSSTDSPTYITMEVVSGSTTNLRCFIGNSSTYTDRAVLHDNNTTIDEITYRYSSSLATFIINGATYTQSRSSGYNTGGHCLFLFARNKGDDAAEQLLSMKLYGCRIYIGGILQRDLMPCKRKSDGTIGVWDKAKGVFYSNAGSGAFTAGPKIGITLSSNRIALTTAGQTSQLTVSANPSSIGNQGYTWSSSDTTVATVSSSGLVTCVAPGNCTITCTSVAGGYTAECSITPKKPDFDFYYDFRGGSLAGFQAAGGTGIWTDGSYTIDSGGLGQTGGSNDRNTHAYITGLDFDGATYAYTERLGYRVRNSWSNGKGMGLGTSYNGGNGFNGPGVWGRINLNTSSPETYSTNGVNYYPDGATNYEKYAANGGETTERLEINFETKIVKYILTGANSKTFQISITDAQKEGLLGMTGGGWNWGRGYSSYNNERIRWVKIHIEY